MSMQNHPPGPRRSRKARPTAVVAGHSRRAGRLLFLVLMLAGCAAPGPSGDDDDSAPVGDDDDDSTPADVRAEWPPPEQLGGDRPAALRVPDAYDGWQAMPLVVLLGGFWNLASDLDGWLDMSGRVDTDEFLLLLPDGTIDPDGAPFWNATDTCCDFYGSGVDDAGYLRGLIDEAVARLSVDTDRVVLLGHSNGGFMAYRMACEPDSPVTALVSIAGSGWLDPDDCEASHPVSVLQVHGELDDVVLFDGDADAPGALELLARWAERAGCSGGLQEDPARREYADEGIENETIASSYGGCAAGLAVDLWLMEGSDHYPEFRAGFAAAALDWLFTHPGGAEG